MIKNIAFCLAFAGIAIAPVTAIGSTPKKPAKTLSFGKKLSIGNGRFKEGSIYAGWVYYNEKLMRKPEFDERVTSVQRGPFPVSDMDFETDALYLNISIDVSGAILKCSVSKPAANLAITEHACPHFMKYARFYPALGSDGLPKAVSGDFYVSYSVTLTGKGVPPPTYVVAAMGQIPNGRNASPTQELNPETLGLQAAKLAKIGAEYVRVMLDIDRKGNVTRCYFDSATFDNETDKTLCQRVSAIKFEPAREASGNAVNDKYIFSLSFDKKGKWTSTSTGP